MRFQNRCNKVLIELRVVQFWSEIILVISNRTCAARSFDFEITRMISDQIALQSQFNYHYKFPVVFFFLLNKLIIFVISIILWVGMYSVKQNNNITNMLFRHAICYSVYYAI